MAAVQIASVFTALGFKVDKKDLDNLQKQIGNLKKQLRSLQGVAKLDIDPNTKGLMAAKKQLAGINQELSKIKNKTINVRVGQTGGARGSAGTRGFAGGAVAGQLGQFGPGVGVTGALAFSGAKIFQTTAQLDAMRNALSAASGSVAEGDKQFQFLRETTKRIGVNFMDNTRSYTNFLAASKAVGFSTKNAQDSFTATASAARVLGLSAADTAGAMRAMTQILSKGTVQSEELRGQLGERLPGAVGLMAKAVAEMTGVTEVSVAELNKMLEQGQIISKDVMPFFSKQVLKLATANGALARAQKSPLANFERMRNSFVDFQEVIGKAGFVKQLSKAFVDVTGALDGSTDGAKALGGAFTVIVGVFRSFISLFQEIPTVFLPVGLVLAAFATPLLAAITLIGLIIILVDDLVQTFQGKEGTLFNFSAQGFNKLNVLIDKAFDDLKVKLTKMFVEAVDSGMNHLDVRVQQFKAQFDFSPDIKNIIRSVVLAGTDKENTGRGFDPSNPRIGAEIPTFTSGETPPIELVISGKVDGASDVQIEQKSDQS